MDTDSRTNSPKWRERARRCMRGALVLVLASCFALSLPACDGGLFDVENPTNILDEDLADPGLADALGNTPEVAVANAYDDGTAWSGIMADEGFLAGSGTFRIQIDEGFTRGYNQQYDDLYNDLAASRWIADDATRRVIELVANPGSDVRVARGHFWSGVARITLADLYEDVVYDNNPPVSPRQGIRDAIERFEEAAQIAEAAGDLNLAGAARGAIARAYRSLYWEELHHGGGEDQSLFQQAADAAAAALALNSEFIEYANYAPPGSENFVFNSLNQSRYNRMDPKYANQLDPVSGELDPRIQHGENQGPSVRTGDPVYLITKYPDESGDIPVSRADEARLIIAEYEAMYGTLSDAVDMINEVRSGVGLIDFNSTDQQEVIDQLRYERIVEFWFELRRWQDMRYYEIIPERWADVNKQAGVHRRWPVSQREKDNNPAYSGG